MTILVWAVVLLSAWGGGVSAARAQAPAAAPARAPASSRAFPIPELPEQAARVRALLREAQLLAADTAKIDAIAEALPALTRRVQSRSGPLEGDGAQPPPIEILDDLQTEWEGFDRTVREWNQVLSTRAEALDRELTRLGDLAELWKRTRASAREASAPRPVLDQLAGTLERIESERKGTKQSRDRVLTLQARLASLGERISGRLEAIASARDRLLERLFVRDALPLWSGRLLGQDLAAIPGELGARLSEDFEQVARYLTQRQSQILLEALALLGVVALLVAARRSAGQGVAPAPLQPEALQCMLGRPISATILVYLPLAPWLHPEAPPFLGALAGSLALAPALRILLPLFGPALRPAIVALAGFYLADQLRHAAAGVPLAPRALFVLEMAVGTVVLLWILRPARLASLPPARGRERRFRWVGRGLQAVRAAFVASLVASIAGYMQLAVRVGAGVLESAYLATLLYAVVKIGEAGVVLLLGARGAGRLNVVRRAHDLLERRATRGLHVAAGAAWVLISLGFFSLWRGFEEGILGLLGARLEVGNLAVSLGGVLLFVVAVWGSFLISRLVRFVLDEEIYPRLDLHRGVPYAISSLAHYAILLLGFLLAIFAAGVDLNRFALLAGAFGIGIGFGLQNVVNNFVSGLILLFERPVQVGDTIQIEDLLGDVRRIGIRSSTLRTWDGAEVIVPNANLISERVTNWTLSDRLRRIDLPVGVAYGTDPERVIGILTEMARSHPDVVSLPTPEVHFLGFGESSLDFQVRAWTAHFSRWLAIRSELAVATNRVLREAQIEIPYPQRDLHLRSVDPSLRGAPQASALRPSAGHPSDGE
ncbi:MAG: mechanosensitive ion channel domain-containing protein [Myxococcota bacterium]